MDERKQNQEKLEEKIPYTAPCIYQKHEIVIELQTNYIPDEPPPPL